MNSFRKYLGFYLMNLAFNVLPECSFKEHFREFLYRYKNDPQKDRGAYRFNKTLISILKYYPPSVGELMLLEVLHEEYYRKHHCKDWKMNKSYKFPDYDKENQ